MSRNGRADPSKGQNVQRGREEPSEPWQEEKVLMVVDCFMSSITLTVVRQRSTEGK